MHDPGEPRAGGPASAASEPVQAQVVVRRSPRYNHFMLLGAIIGAVAALILTVAFPANPDYDRAQVFGYLLLVGVALGVGLGALVALILDRVVGRQGKSVIADWVENAPDDAHDTPATRDARDARDTRHSRQGDGA